MVNIAIPNELGAALEAVANRDGHSADEYAQQAIANFLEDLEDVAIARERFDNPVGTISLDELKKNLGLDA